MINIEITCPFGHRCERVAGEVVSRCALYTNIKGKDPQSEEIIDEWRCALSWTPILMVENAQTNRGQTQALESFRNEVVRQNDQIINMDKKQLGLSPKQQIKTYDN